MSVRDSTRNAVSPEKNPPTDCQFERRSPAGKLIGGTTLWCIDRPKVGDHRPKHASARGGL